MRTRELCAGTIAVTGLWFFVSWVPSFVYFLDVWDSSPIAAVNAAFQIVIVIILVLSRHRIAAVLAPENEPLSVAISVKEFQSVGLTVLGAYLAATGGARLLSQSVYLFVAASYPGQIPRDVVEYGFDLCVGLCLFRFARIPPDVTS